MADNKRRGRFGRGGDDGGSPSIFDLFEPPPEVDSSSFTRIPIIRDDDDDAPLDLTATELAGAQAAAEAEAAGLAHWTEPPTGQLPAALANGVQDDRWADVRGPSWQGEEPNWAGPDLSDVFADTDPITHRRVVEDDNDFSVDPAPTMPPRRRPVVRTDTARPDDGRELRPDRGTPVTTESRLGGAPAPAAPQARPVPPPAPASRRTGSPAIPTSVAPPSAPPAPQARAVPRPAPPDQGVTRPAAGEALPDQGVSRAAAGQGLSEPSVSQRSAAGEALSDQGVSRRPAAGEAVPGQGAPRAAAGQGLGEPSVSPRSAAGQGLSEPSVSQRAAAGQGLGEQSASPRAAAGQAVRAPAPPPTAAGQAPAAAPGAAAMPPSVFDDPRVSAAPAPARPRPEAPAPQRTQEPVPGPARARPSVSLESGPPTAPPAPPRHERPVLGRGTISVDEALGEASDGYDDPPRPTRRPSQPLTATFDEPSDGYDGYDPYPDDDDTQPSRGLAQRVAVGIGLAALVLVTLSLGPDVAMVLVGLIALLAVMELFNTMRIAGLRPATLLGLVGTVALPAAAYVRGESAYPLVIGLAVVFGMLWYLTGADTERPVLNLGLTFTGVLWVGGLAGFAALMMRAEEGVGLLLTAIIVTSVSDTLAYLGGRAYGTRPFHSASPNKTWEGTLTGFFGALLAGLVLGVTDVIGVFDGQFVSVMVMAAVIGVLAPIGDLAESLVKRDLGVKDMGHLLPGHGGVLDRIDGLLFALPATYYVAVVFELI